MLIADLTAARAEADRLRAAMQEAVDSWEGETADWCLAGIKDALDATPAPGEGQEVFGFLARQKAISRLERS